MDYALFAHEKLALLGLSCNAFPEAYNPRPHFDYISQRPSKKRGGRNIMMKLTIQHATPTIKTLTIVRRIFVGEAKYRPLFI